jgi:hypothetical protein
MCKIRLGLLLLLGCAGLGCSDGLEPSNIDLGLRVEAQVTPRVVSLADASAELRIRILVTNPGSHDIIVVTGGPPYLIRRDPTDGGGLTQSLRIATATEPLNAGPAVDTWGEPVDTIRAQHGEYIEQVLTVGEWKAGWGVGPGEFRVRSWYNGREGESASFTLTP